MLVDVVVVVVCWREVGFRKESYFLREGACRSVARCLSDFLVESLLVVVVVFVRRPPWYSCSCECEFLLHSGPRRGGVL